MGKVLAALTYLACAVSLISLLRALGIEIGSQPGMLVPGDALRSAAHVAVAAVVGAAGLLLPTLIAGWLAYLSRTSPLLGSVPLLLMLWVLLWINGFELMAWHPLSQNGQHGGVSLNFALSLLSVFYHWPATLVCLVAWNVLRRRLRRRATDATRSDSR